MKKVISIILVLVLTAGIILGALMSGASNVDANKLLLESLLNNRSWVVESLVNGDFENNPYTQVCIGATEESIMEEVLENYQDSLAFKTLVDGMEIYSNTGQYVTNWTEEMISALLEFFNLADAASLDTYVNDNIKSVEAIHYQDIINDVLTEDYTSSWGSTLFEADSDLEQYRQMSKVLKNLSNYQKALKDNNDILASGFFESSEDFMDYTDNFLEAYEDTLYDALVNIPQFSGAANHEALTKKILGASALAFVLGAETYNPLKTNYSESAYQGSLLAEKYDYYFAEDIGRLLNGTGKVINFSSNALQYAMIANALAAQTETTASVLERVRNTTTNEDLQQTLKFYKKLVEDQGKTDALAIDSVLDYLSRQDKVGKEVLKQGGKLFTNVVNLRHGYFDGSKMVMTNALCENLIKAGKCVAIAVWVADKATNIQDTAKKIYICKYTNKIIKEAAKTYRADLNTYQGEKTDENAKKVLDDLEFLKKLRLYGEKQGYESLCSQTDSIIGILLGSEDVKDTIDQHYQSNVDALLGCTFVPMAGNTITVSSGEQLYLYPEHLKDGTTTLKANYMNKDGKMLVLPEADLIFMNGLTLSGGTLKIFNNTANSETAELFINRINISKPSAISLRGSKLVAGEIINRGDLTLEYLDAATEFTVSSSFNNSGTVSINTQGSSIQVQELNNSGTIDIHSGEMKALGNVNSSEGIFTGKVDICGDGSSLYQINYQQADLQTISGTATFEKIYFNNDAKEGVNITGKQVVSGHFSDGNSRLRNSNNLCLTGNCALENNRSKNSLGFIDYSSSNALTIGGNAYLSGDISFSGNTTFNDGLFLTQNCKSLEVNSPITVKGDFEYASGTITGNEWLTLCGDANVTASSPTFSKLNFYGLVPQKFSCNKEITVSELDNHNYSLRGVEISTKVNVTDVLHSGNTSAYADAKNLVLTGNARLNGNRINGSISAKNWSCNNNCVITGTLYASGDINIGENINLEVFNYTQSSGSLAIGTGGTLHCKNEFSQAGTTVNNGSVIVDGDSKVSNRFTGGIFSVKGDINASAAIVADELILSAKVPQYFNNSSTTEITNLTINNTSNGGTTIESVIQVNGSFVNNAKKLVNGSNVKLNSNALYTDNGLSKSDLTISGVYTVAEGKTLTINGTLTLQSGASLTVQDGATIIVKKGMISQKSSIEVNEGGKIVVDDYYSSSNNTIDISGSFVMKGDAKITSSTISGSGLISFGGDLTVSSGTWNKPNLAFVGKVPQSFSGSAINVGNLVIHNTSKSGISIESNVNYYGTVNTNDSVIVGESRLVKKG